MDKLQKKKKAFVVRDKTLGFSLPSLLASPALAGPNILSHSRQAAVDLVAPYTQFVDSIGHRLNCVKNYAPRLLLMHFYIQVVVNRKMKEVGL